MSPFSLLEVVFWTAVAATGYAYMGFPLLARLLVRCTRPAPPVDPSPEPTETITIIVPAYNEEASIAAKIRNTLESDYPRHLLDVIVVSDASTDGTDAIARFFEPQGVRLLVQEHRCGKTAGLNRAVEVARGSILVFTDANAMYAPNTLRALEKHFEDSTVGLVSGYTRYRLTTADGVSEITNTYTSLERTIKRAESRWACCVGADGAIFAMRRTLYRALRDDDINDFVLPLSVIDQGYGCVFAEDAFCFESPGQDLESEFKRQARITNRTLRALSRRVHLLNPLRFPSFAFFVISHKVTRFLVPLFVIAAGLSLLALMPVRDVYLALASLAAAAFCSRLLFRWMRPAGDLAIVRLADAFLTVNLAIALGWWKFLTRQADVTWQPDRGAIEKSASGHV